MYERCGFNDNVALMIAALLQRIPRRPLDTSTTRRHDDPAEEGEQGTLEGALPDPIFKVTMGGEEEGHQGSFVMLASRNTNDENYGRFPLDNPSTSLCWVSAGPRPSRGRRARDSRGSFTGPHLQSHKWGGRGRTPRKLRDACLKRHSRREHRPISPQQPLDDPLLCLCRARSQQRRASKRLSREIQYMVGVVVTLYSSLKKCMNDVDSMIMSH